MAKSKRIISLLLSFIMIMSVFTIVPFTANAAEAEVAATAKTEGDYEYSILGNGKAEITKYTGEGGDVTIPSTLGGYTVTSIGRSAFSWCEGLTSVTIGKSVSSIGYSAFYGCTGLTRVTIGKSVSSIGDYAFYGCTSLPSIDIPDSVTSIGDLAFDDCTGLTRVTIGKSVSSIGSYAFSGCTSLTSIDIPDSVTRIGGLAFYKCTGLTRVTIGKSVTSIGGSAFDGCTSLTSIDIPDSVTSIGYEAFENCTGLTSVTISGPITSIERSAFDNTAWYNNQPDGLVYAGKVAYTIKGDCPSEVVIKNGTLSINQSAFSDCKNLTSIDIPNSVTRIGRSAFEGCTNLSDITFSENCTHYGYDAFTDTAWYNAQPDGVLYTKTVAFDIKNSVPETVVIKDGTKHLADYLFGGSNNVSKVVLPDSLESIGNGAFSDCRSLYSITFGKNIKNIGDNVFYQCNRLYNVYIKDLRGWCELEFKDMFSNPMCFAPNLYLNDELITDLVIPDGITKVGDYQFCYCLRFKTVTIPNSVTSIGVSAFQCLDVLEAIDIPNSVKTIGDQAFFFSEKLKTVNISSSVTKIGKKAFNYCDSLEKITVSGGNPVYDSRNNCNAIIETGTNTLICGCKNTVIPSSVTAIGDSAFYACKKTEMTIPDSIKTIGKEAFAWSGSLVKVSIGNSVTDIGESAFRSCENMAKVTFGNSVTSIGDSAFGRCGITDVTIPDSVKTIGPGAFGGCADLEDLVISHSVTEIAERAFSSCSSLTEVTIPDSVTSIGDGAFTFCRSLTEVTIPDSVTSIGEEAFKYCTGLTSITIPDSVTNIGKTALGYSSYSDHKIDGFTIYGHKGTTAEAYANENGFRFRDPLVAKTDKNTRITISVPADTEIKAKKITESNTIAAIKAELPEPSKIISVYDIELTKDGKAVQPETAIKVKIPCDNKDAVVYRKESDNTMTAMNAKYKNGYMVFNTDHFNVYVLAEPIKITGVTVSGKITSYVDESDVFVKLTGTDNNFAAEIKGKANYSIREVPAGKYTLTVSKYKHVTREYTVTVVDKDMTQDVELFPLGDVNNDGKVNNLDKVYITRYLAKWDKYQDIDLAAADVDGNGKVNNLDKVILTRHLANWDDYAVLPYVK